jgi:hypothetical protein
MTEGQATIGPEWQREISGGISSRAIQIVNAMWILGDFLSCDAAAENCGS